MNTRVARITFAAWALIATAAAAGDFYVAPNGNDANPGTKEKPFATPARAMAAVRSLASEGLKTDISVVLRGGIYALAAPLVFTSADSGIADHTISYSAEPGETVVISGGRAITNWTASGGSKWTAELAGVKSGQWFFRQLVVNDQRAVRARWPNEDGVLHLATVESGIKSFTFDRALPQENLGGQDAELVVYENWSVSRALISSSDQRQLATATAVGWVGHGDMTTASPGKPAFIEHARFALDQPREWFLDRSTGTLTYLAAPGEKPAQSVAVAPVLTQLVKIAGTKIKPVRNLRFERLRFEHTDFSLPSIGYSEIQAAHFGSTMKMPTQVQPVAIECSYAEGLRFERCRLAHLNNSGIGFGPGCRRNAVVGCVIEDIGGNGVMVGWRGTGRLENRPDGMLDSDWMDPTDAPAKNEISNCVIQRCGADSRGAVGIFVAFSAETRVAHNVIHDLPYTGVSIGYRWDTTPTCQVRCMAEYNHIYDVMKTLADGGGFYTLGFQSGTVFRGNLIHDVHRSANAQGGAPNNGFFIDEGSKGFLFESNVVYKTSGESVRFNQCRREWHTWKGNAFDGEATEGRISTAAERAGLEPGYEALAPTHLETTSTRQEFEPTNLPPLVDLGPGQTYRGHEGGLYPGGSNLRPAAHDAGGQKIARGIVPLDADGNPDPINGKIVLMPVSVSNGYGAWHRGDENDTSTTFMTRANANPARNPKLLIAYGFEYQLPGGNGGTGDPGLNSIFYKSLDQALKDQGITPRQVQIVWLSMPVSGRSWGTNLPPGARTFPADAQESKLAWKEIVHAIYTRYPNVKIIYSSTKGAMYMSASPTKNAEFIGGPIEPFNHDAAWGVKWVIEDQINGAPDLNYDPARGPVKAPWLSWGPYLWSYPDGAPRHFDGLVWSLVDVAADGLHPSLSGLTKYANMLLHQMTTDPTATPWFLKPGAPPNAAPAVVKEASAAENPVSGDTATLSVLGADDGGEPNLTYTWSCTGPEGVTLSVNGPNRAKNTSATFKNAGRYTFKVTIADVGGLTATSTIAITVIQR